MRGTFRADIEGLRAVCVIAVVLYHAFPAWLRGGFIGVDIFFVISGYLITGLLLNEVQQTGSIDVLRFWAAASGASCPPPPSSCAASPPWLCCSLRSTPGC